MHFDPQRWFFYLIIAIAAFVLGYDGGNRHDGLFR